MYIACVCLILYKHDLFGGKTAGISLHNTPHQSPPPDISQIGTKPVANKAQPFKSAQIPEPKSSSSPASSISSTEQILRQIKLHKQKQDQDLNEFAQSLVQEVPPPPVTDLLRIKQQQQQSPPNAQHIHQQQQQQQQLQKQHQTNQSKNEKNTNSKGQARNNRRLGRHESRYTSGNNKTIFVQINFLSTIDNSLQ